MTQRLIFGSLLIIAVAAIVWGDIQISSITSADIDGLDWRCGSLIPLVMMLLAMAGALECVNLSRAAGFVPMAWVVFVGVLLLNATAWLVPAGVIPTERSHFEWQLIILVLATLLIGIQQVLRRRTERAIADISVSIMMVIYMGILPSFITATRTLMPGSTGVWAVVLFVTVVKVADIGAYFTGSMIGRTKLIPAVSPLKTVEGFAGGLLLAIVVSIVLSATLPWPHAADATPISFFQAALFGALIAIVGAFGDLVESIFKRDATSKDSSRVIPAFGGILDLLDSPTFAAPLAYLLLSSWLT